LLWERQKAGGWEKKKQVLQKKSRLLPSWFCMNIGEDIVNIPVLCPPQIFPHFFVIFTEAVSKILVILVGLRLIKLIEFFWSFPNSIK